MKRKYLNACLMILFVLFIIIGDYRVWRELEKGKYFSELEPDEPAWIFSGYYFNLYFLRFDLFHPDWSDDEAFDQPPLAKYIVGGALFLRGYTIDSLEPKRFWNTIRGDKLHHIQSYYDQVIDRIPNRSVVIPSTRFVIAMFALFSLPLLYISVRMLYGVLPAMVSAMLIISHPIFIFYSMRILADPVLLFFLALFTLLCALYLKSQKHLYIIFAFVVSSLAFLTKLNGIVLVFVLLITFLLKNKFSISKQDCKFLAMGFVIFLFISVLLNPVFLNTGVKAIWKMVEVRSSASRMLQETFQGAALLSVSERFLAATRMIFFKYSLFYQLIKVPLELMMFVAGIYYILKTKDIFLLTLFGFLVILPVSMLPLDFPRYCYWIFPFTYIIAGLSLNLLKDIFDGKDFWFLKG